MTRLLLLFAGWVALFVASCTGSPALAAPAKRSFVNLSGYEINWGSGTERLGWNHNLPSDATLAWAAANFVGVRLPISEDRMQAEDGTIRPEKMAELVGLCVKAKALGLRLIVDIHGFGYIHGRPIDTAAPVYLTFVRATAIAIKDCAWGLELNNEPKDMDAARLRPVMQAAADTVRVVAPGLMILVPQPGYSPAWAGLPMPRVASPAPSKILDVVHAYADGDSSGTYQRRYAADMDVGTGRSVTADTLVDRLRPAVEQAKREGRNLIVTEYGAPVDEPERVEQVRRADAYLRRVSFDRAYFPAGDWTGADRSSIGPGRGAAMLEALSPAR